MKKNISINISGIIFHIEEDGYESLRRYLDSVNKYFAAFDDSSEILADIEGRIAEIFLSKLNDGKQVITADDVVSLIATMGSVSDFKAAEEQEIPAGEPSASNKKQGAGSGTASSTPPKKLQRDQQRKVLGGVCAGLGHYFNIDAVWPRVLIVLLTLTTSGIFLIVYIVLWIVLPAAELEEQASVKKMYRDPDRKVVGGVAAGVAAFFGADLTLIRVLLVVLAFGGVGIILYIILWIALPEANTITEKMQMQGEPVTLSNIESSVKKGLNEKEGAEENVFTRIILFPFRLIAAILNGIGKVLGPAIAMLVDVLRVAIGIVMTMSGLFMLLSLIFAFGILIGMFHTPNWEMFSDWRMSSLNLPLDAMRNTFSTWTAIFAFFVAVVPAIFLLLLGSSIVARRFVFNGTVGWSLFVIFVLSISIISFTVPQLVMGFKEEGEFRVEQSFDLHGKIPVFKIHETGLDDYDVTSLTLRGYDGKDIKLVEKFEAQGPTRKVAAENAQMIEYNVTQTDSILNFDSNITFMENAKFRAQRLDVDIFVPYNQNFEVDAKLWRLIDTRIIDNGRFYRYSLNQETQTWKMTDKGLVCVSCPAAPEEPGQTANDQFGFKDFNSVDLKGLFDVRIQKGDVYAVEIKGSETLRKRYDVYVNGETLVIDFDDHRKFFWQKDGLGNEVRINITMPELRELDVTGAGKLKFRGFDADEVDISLTGAVMADGDITANSLNVKLTGASFLDLNGSGRLLDADITGASGLRAYGYEVQHCIVEAHGASIAKVNVTETLEMKKGMTSSISHRGNPEVIKR